MSYGYVYSHKNKENDKIYVGQSIQDAKRRFRKTQSGYNSYRCCPAFFSALQKYTWDGFETTILGYADSQEELNLLEEKFIKELEAVGEKGYNTVSYSQGRGVQAESTKRKISERQKAAHARKGPQVPHNRREHRFVNDVEEKYCGRCEEWKFIGEFNNHSTLWDKLSGYCSECQANSAEASRQQNPIAKLDQEQWDQSYIDRNEAMAAGVKRAHDANPQLAKDISRRNSKPIKCTNLTTGEVKIYDKALDAKADGFQNSNIGQAIKYNKTYKNCTWEFVKKS